ncbi:outer membrane protein [Parvularcula dongshanensis]|uniref:Outer membrane immunogenic protein n=1 Tax=Parvularcula dongshanensis TaxID=1173995 RepID=A0A840I575_9PROT|nr:outer membrane beta-barrel protein [Parvularcula dongshanensis]MBB4659433.1 outer membrane immunogenic protein [Parvularcula dongshanensis]
MRRAVLSAALAAATLIGGAAPAAMAQQEVMPRVPMPPSASASRMEVAQLGQRRHTRALRKREGSALRRLGGARIEARVGLDSFETESGAKAEGPTYGGSIGYDHLLFRTAYGGLFLGGFASYDQAAGDDAVFAQDLDNGAGGVTHVEATSGFGRDLEVGVRAGWMTSRVTLYALAALSDQMRTDTVVTTVTTTTDNPDDPRNPVVTESEPDTVVDVTRIAEGWRVGGGAELRLVGDLYAKAEYRYSVYDEDEKRQQVVTGLGLRF